MSFDSFVQTLRDDHAVFTTSAIIPEHFGSPADEQQAARERCVVIPCIDRTQVEVQGEDRHSFVHNFCTANVKTWQVGQGGETFLTNIKGRVVAHVFAFVDERSIWLETVPDQEERIISHLDHYLISEDVSLIPRTNELSELLICGPHADATLGRLGIDTGGWNAYQHQTISFADVELHFRKVDWLLQPAFLVSTPREKLFAVWQELQRVDVVPAGSSTFTALRIEAGFPLYGVDISEERLAPEVGRNPQAISFTKGCYLGQEPISRVDSMGHVNVELRGLAVDSADLPPAGSSITDAEGNEVGTITSAALSLPQQQACALAYLKSQCTSPGTRVTVQTAAGTSPATVYWPNAS